MLVVSDTTPLNYLILIEAESVLPALYTSILVPSQVIEELQRQKAPERVRLWTNSLPGWVHVQTGDASRFPALDLGEAAALALAVDTQAQLLADDAEARAMARAVGIVTIGTVGILAEAHIASLLDFDTAIRALRTTSFHVHDAVIAAARRSIQALQSDEGDQ